MSIPQTNLSSSTLQHAYLQELQVAGSSPATLARKQAALAAFNAFLTPTTTPKSPKIIQTISRRPLLAYGLFTGLLLSLLGLGYFLYQQAYKQAQVNLAYPASLTRPTRQLSFQGRLTDTSGNPIMVSTNIGFKLWTAGTGGTELYTTGTGGTATPDTNGIFSAIIGNNVGSEIPATVFSENQNVWLEITVNPNNVGTSEVMSPRQQIASVGYALNAETLQGYPPIGVATSNAVLVLDGNGDLNLAVSDPSFISTSGTFGIEGQAMTLKATDTTNGSITINPDGTGVLNITSEGTSPSTGGAFINLNNANISSGNLLGSVIGNNNRGYNFIQLKNQSAGVTGLRFEVTSDGDVTIANRLGIGATNTAYALNVVGAGNFSTNLNIGNSLTVTGNSYLTGSVRIGSTLFDASNVPGTLGQVLVSTGTGVSWAPVPAGTYSWIAGSDNGTTTVQSGNTLTFDGINGLTTSTVGTSITFGLGGSLTATTNIATSGYSLNFLGLGGSQALTIGPSGYVGIGTTNPAYKLDVNGTGRFTDDLYLNGGQYIYNTTAGSGASSGGVRVEESTTNLVVNPSIETNTTSWTNSGCETWGSSMTRSLFGQSSLRCNNTSSVATTYISVAVSENTAYTYTAWVYVDSGNVSIYLDEADTAWEVHSNSPTTTGEWQRLTSTFTTGAGVSSVNLRVVSSFSSDFYIDGVQLEQKSYATAYTDGSFGAGYAWTGSAHASTSTRTAGHFIADRTIFAPDLATSDLTAVGTLTVGTTTLVTTNTGNVGIGTTSPQQALDVVGNVRASIFIDNSDSRFFLDPGSTSQGLSLGGLGMVSFNVGSSNSVYVPAQSPGANGISSKIANIQTGLILGVSSNTTANTTISDWDANALFIGYSGSFGVGIGTTKPRTTFQIGTDVGGTGAILTFNSVGNTGGYLGLGTTAPSALLHIVGTAYTGPYFKLDWSPLASNVTTTSDLFTINIGSSGNAASLFNIKDSNSSIFNVTETAVTSNIPANFTSPGDLSVAYDINFNNPTASYLKSAAPLYLQSGETFNSSDLTLRTYNSGNIVLDAGTSGAILPTVNLQTNLGNTNYRYNTAWVNVLNVGSSTWSLKNLSAGSTRLGFFNRSSDVGGTEVLSLLDSGRVGIGTTNPLYTLQVSGDALISTRLGIGSTNALYALNVGNSANFTNLSTSGHVGIGTTAPGARLNIYATGEGGGEILKLSYVSIGWTAGHGPKMTFYGGPDNRIWGEMGSFLETTGSGADGYMSFSTRTSEALTEKVRITSAGRLGIGTTAPSKTLHVYSTSAGDHSAIIANANGTGYGLIVSAANDPIRIGGNGDTAGTLFKITGTGYVGIGNTNPTAPLDIGSTTQVGIRMGDSNWYLGTLGGSANPIINYDANDYQYYNRTDNRLHTVVGSAIVTTVTTNAFGIGSAAAVPTRMLDIGDSIIRMVPIGNGVTASLANNGDIAIGSTGTAASSGRIWIRTNGTTFRFQSDTNTADYSEYFYQGNTTSEEGDLMAYDTTSTNPIPDTSMVKKANSSSNSKLIGVVTSQERGTGDNNDNENRVGNPLYANVGLLGHVWTKVSTINGPIQPGDPLTTSSIPGVAQKATQAGIIIGLAAGQHTATDPNEITKIMAFINPTYYLPGINLDTTGQIVSTYATSPTNLMAMGLDPAKSTLQSANYKLVDSLGHTIDSIVNFGTILSGKIETGILQATNIVSKVTLSETSITKDLSVQTISPLGSAPAVEVNGNLNVSGVLSADSLSTDQLVTSQLVADTATISTLYADNIISKNGSIEDLLTNKIASIRAELNTLVTQNIQTTLAPATPSALASQTDSWLLNIATNSATLHGDLSLTDNLVVAGNLAVAGNLQMANALISQQLQIDQIQIGGNYIKSINNTLAIAPDKLGTVSILGDILTISDTGVVAIKGDLTVTGLLSAQTLSTNLLTTDLLVTKQINIATDSAELIIASDATGSATTTTGSVQSNATAGVITLPAGTTELTVQSNKLSPGSLVYLTPNGSTSNQVVYVKSKVTPTPEQLANQATESANPATAGPTSSFTIAIDQPITSDISVNWWIIN